MREKEEEDNTKQKVPLYTRCSQLTCILIPTQLTCVLIRTPLMQPSLEPTRLPRAKRSRMRCLPSRRTVPMPESNNQIQTFPSNQTLHAPRLAETCVVTLLARGTALRIARLFSSTNRRLSPLLARWIALRIARLFSSTYRQLSHLLALEIARRTPLRIALLFSSANRWLSSLLARRTALLIARLLSSTNRWFSPLLTRRAALRIARLFSSTY